MSFSQLGLGASLFVCSGKTTPSSVRLLTDHFFIEVTERDLFDDEFSRLDFCSRDELVLNNCEKNETVKS
jgi:hypothetical protein